MVRRYEFYELGEGCLESNDSLPGGRIEPTLCEGKRRKGRGHSHEWQPVWVGSSVPGALQFHKPSRFTASGACAFTVV